MIRWSASCFDRRFTGNGPANVLWWPPNSCKPVGEFDEQGHITKTRIDKAQRLAHIVNGRVMDDAPKEEERAGSTTLMQGFQTYTLIIEEHNNGRLIRPTRLTVVYFKASPF